MVDQIQAKRHGIGVRLPIFLQIVRVAALLVVFLFLFAVWKFESYFASVEDVGLFFKIIIVFAIVNPVFTYFVPRLVKSRVFYSAYLYNIMWAFFLTAAVYSMGGVQSYFVIILIFPILTTAFDLEARATATLGIIIEVLFAVMMFFDPRHPHMGSYFVAGVMNMFYLGLFTYYLYSIIKEGIRQRFEKEDAKRKYFDLTEIDQAKTEFITVTSHQLQTPMSEVRWALNTILEMKRWDADAETIVLKSIGSVNKLVDITKSLMRVARFEKPELMYRRTPVHLIEEINAVLKDLKSEIDQKSVVVLLNHPREDFTINGDPDYLRMALFNVIDNGVRYTPNGTVTITLAKERDGVLIKIADTGIGIPPQEQAQIFTRFFRASNALKLEPSETGVGLYITKRIVEKHNGTIDFVSGVGKETTFTIFLPSLPGESIAPQK